MDTWYWTSGTDLEKNCKFREFPGGTVVKNLPCNAGNMGSIPGWELRFHMLRGNKARAQLKVQILQ